MDNEVGVVLSFHHAETPFQVYLVYLVGVLDVDTEGRAE